MAQPHKRPQDLYWGLAVIIRGVLIVLLAGTLTAGAYMIRIQSQEIASLRSDIDAANQTISALHNQVMAIQAAYQVRDKAMQEAENVSNQRMQILDAASSDWADCLLPSDIGGMFSDKTGSAGNSSDAAGNTVSGDTGPAVDAQNK